MRVLGRVVFSPCRCQTVAQYWIINGSNTTLDRCQSAIKQSSSEVPKREPRRDETCLARELRGGERGGARAPKVVNITSKRVLTTLDVQETRF